MPLALLVLVAAGAALYLAARGSAPSSADDAAGGPSAAVDFGNAAQLVVQRGQALVESFGQTVSSLWKLPAAAAPYADAINAAEVKNSLPDGLLGRVLYQESRFRADIISGETKSRTGATGIAQLMPATAEELGVDPLDPVSSIDGAARYLKQLFNRFGNWSDAIAAYNWGQGNVARRGLGQAPKETRDYVEGVLTDIGIS